MPIYDYKCNKCGRVFEYQQRISENALTTCPPEICEQKANGNGEVERIISKNIGLVFKGSGFYLTDYNGKKSESKPIKEENLTQPKNQSNETTNKEPKNKLESSAKAS